MSVPEYQKKKKKKKKKSVINLLVSNGPALGRLGLDSSRGEGAKVEAGGSLSPSL